MKKSIVTMAVAAALFAFQADAASPTLDQVVACASIADSAARLTCFDRAVAPLAQQAASFGRPAKPATPAPVPAVPATAPPAPPPSPAFGQEMLTREQRPVPKDAEVSLHALIASQKPAGGGYFNLYLDNGQVWRHQDQVQGPFLKDGDAVTIEKAALGSYKLSRDAGKSRNWIRVTRIR